MVLPILLKSYQSDDYYHGEVYPRGRIFLHTKFTVDKTSKVITQEKVHLVERLPDLSEWFLFSRVY